MDPVNYKVLYGGVLFGDAERKAVEKVIDKNWWGLADEGWKFERELAKIQDVKKAIFVNSGSSALDVGIRSLRLPKGSEVIVPACTFPTPIASLIREGLIPVVVDIDPQNYFMLPDLVVKSISDKTKAILIVYAAGIVGDLESLLTIAKNHKLKVIEDNCDGFGGTWKGKMLGSFGEFSVISTHPAHIISTGGGGVFFTNNSQLADRAVAIRDWGRINDFENRKQGLGKFPSDCRRYIYSELGSNYQPLELQAAMGRVQLRRLKEFKRARQKNFEILFEKLSPYRDALILPKANENADCCWYTFPITLKSFPRRKVLVALDKAKIEWRPILSSNIAHQPAFKNHVIRRVKTPNADKLVTDSFWVSIHPRHSSTVIRFVADTILKTISA
jgi:CDP-6-deoxy-D-xylo-4-hexulose-3-dehydrase